MLNILKLICFHQLEHLNPQRGTSLSMAIMAAMRPKRSIRTCPPMRIEIIPKSAASFQRRRTGRKCLSVSKSTDTFGWVLKLGTSRSSKTYQNWIELAGFYHSKLAIFNRETNGLGKVIQDEPMVWGKWSKMIQVIGSSFSCAVGWVGSMSRLLSEFLSRWAYIRPAMVSNASESWLGFENETNEPPTESVHRRFETISQCFLSLLDACRNFKSWWSETTDNVILNSPWLHRETGNAFRCAALFFLCAAWFHFLF